jgi:hypothetical protein
MATASAGRADKGMSQAPARPARACIAAASRSKNDCFCPWGASNNGYECFCGTRRGTVGFDGGGVIVTANDDE